MEVPNDPTSTDSTSLDVILDQMEVSTDPDINSLDIVTACAEELILGGEVEVRAAVEVRKPSGSQKPDAESSENIAAGTDDLIFQGGAQGEETGRMDEAIGMEIEVPRKSSSSSDLQSPIKQDQLSPEPVNHGEWEGDTVAGNTAGEEVAQNNVMEGLKEVREKGAERRHKKGLYIPPVTEWRDLLDSQDVIREFAKNMEEGGSVADNDSEAEGAEERDEQRGGTEEPTEDCGEGTSRNEVVARMDTDESEMTTEEDEDGKGYEKEANEILEVVEMERDDEGPCSQPPAPQDTTGEGTGEPDHLELFLPPHDSLYRQTSLSSRATTTAGVGRDLEVAEYFLEVESDLLREAKWVPPPVDGPRQLVPQEDMSTTHTPIHSTRTKDVAQATPPRTRRALRELATREVVTTAPSKLAITAPSELATTALAPRELSTTALAPSELATTALAPRELVTTAPREVVTTAPREVVTTSPREVVTTAPSELATTAPSELVTTALATTAPSEVETTALATTAPRELVTTAPRELATTAPRELATTAPSELATTAPREIATMAPSELVTTALATTAPSEVETTAPSELVTTALATTAPSEVETTALATTAPRERATTALAPREVATTAPRELVTAIRAEDTHSDSSFLYESQMEEEGGGEQVVTLSSPTTTQCRPDDTTGNEPQIEETMDTNLLEKFHTFVLNLPLPEKRIHKQEENQDEVLSSLPLFDSVLPPSTDELLHSLIERLPLPSVTSMTQRTADISTPVATSHPVGSDSRRRRRKSYPCTGDVTIATPPHSQPPFQPRNDEVQH